MASHSFDDLVQAIGNAVIAVRNKLETQHLSTLARYFRQTDSGALEAVTKTVKIPSAEEPNSFTEINVPLLNLVPTNSLKLKEVTVEFDAYISSLESDPNDKSGKKETKQLQMTTLSGGGIGSKKNNAKIKITLEGQDPPEGLIKINEHILKQIP
ncbi:MULTISPECIES: DUF2589 domain-containing protein [Pseudoalteromonas]|uniref:DUF2589 domain-containing protein n=1 Tax=Pseudoalteromonas TaxID=53246 RepID=UPI0005FA310B|nr:MULTISPECIES: DUF2589 domain-containing protein [Pseudoalteromonas]KJZ04636.1 hypothetical protein TW73_03210 [Pseudoalteromonas piscicida]MCG9768812.1 DUF2589 domain-containing protein [Pseudoalteromonas piscicida]ODB37295.1 hypothetical protein BB427_13840 [Pseudoalteromonas sp. BMB]